MSHALERLENFTPRPGPVVLIIMDGVGIGQGDESDGVALAKTPCLDELKITHPLLSPHLISKLIFLGYSLSRGAEKIT